METFSGVWRYSTSTVIADPGAGYLRSSVGATSVAIATVDVDDVDRAAELLSMRVGDELIAQEQTDATHRVRVVLIAEPVDNATWIELTTTVVAEATSTPNNNERVAVTMILFEEGEGTWPYATPEQLADALHIRPSAEKLPALNRALASAATEIDQDLDRFDPLPEPPPEAIVATNIDRAVEWYKAADNAFGIIGTEDTGAIRTRLDGFARHAHNISAYKQRWGIA